MHHIYTFIPYEDRVTASYISREWMQLYNKEIHSYAHPIRENIGLYWRVLLENTSIIRSVMMKYGTEILRHYTRYIMLDLFSLPYVEVVSDPYVCTRVMSDGRCMLICHSDISSISNTVHTIISTHGMNVLSSIFNQFNRADQALMVESYISNKIYRPLMIHWLKNGGYERLRSIHTLPLYDRPYYPYDMPTLLAYLKSHL